MIRPPLALCALALLAACSSGTSPAAAPPVSTPPPPSSAPPSSVPPSSVTAPAGPTTPAAVPTTPAARELRLVVSGGSVTGDTGLVEVAVGEPLRITVTSDVADEVHVHGPGQGFSAEVEAGGTVTVPATETVPGRFEVELERSRRVLTRLQVR